MTSKQQEARDIIKDALERGNNPHSVFRAFYFMEAEFDRLCDLEQPKGHFVDNRAGIPCFVEDKKGEKNG